jgi:hypothetical protein
MPNTAQAQADPTDQPTVADPLDTANYPHDGKSDLADYTDEVSKMLADDTLDMSDDLTEHQDTEVDEPGEEPAEDAAEDDAPEEDDVPASNRFRIRAKDDVEAEALALRKRHPDLSLKECIAKAEHILGVGVDPGAEPAEEEAPRETVATVNTRIEELKAARKEASAEMEFERRDEIQDEIDDLRDRRDELRSKESQARAEADTAERADFEAEYKKSMHKTVTFYPDAKNADSPLTKRMIEMDRQMLELGDPLYHSPDKPFILVKAAARELGTLMVKPAPAQAAPRKIASPSFQPAPGNRGTTATTAPKIVAEVEAITDLGEYERMFGRG